MEGAHNCVVKKRVDLLKYHRKTKKQTGIFLKSRNQKRPGKRDLHFLNDNGMVACNPHDREAAHRAEVEGIATENPKVVTCKKCWTVIRKTEKPRSQKNVNN